MYLEGMNFVRVSAASKKKNKRAEHAEKNRRQFENEKEESFNLVFLSPARKHVRTMS